MPERAQNSQTKGNGFMEESANRTTGGAATFAAAKDLFYGDFAAASSLSGEFTTYGRVVSVTGKWVTLESFGFPKCEMGFDAGRCVRAVFRPYNFREASELVGKTLVRLERDGDALVPVERMLVHRVSLFRANGESFVRINRADCENNLPEDDAARLLDKCFLVEPYLTPCGVAEIADSCADFGPTAKRVSRYFSLFGAGCPDMKTEADGGRSVG